MTRAGKEIANPRTGQRMVFLETGEETDGRLLRIDTFNPPDAPIEPEHVHPFQESRIELVSGSLRVRIDGEEQNLGPGGSVVIPPKTPHFFWNDGNHEAHSIGEFRPALHIDLFFETFFSLARDGKLNEKGLPSLLQLAVSVPEFGNEIRLTRPPWIVQKVIFGSLAPLARLRGYRPVYRDRKGHGDESVSKDRSSQRFE